MVAFNRATIHIPLIQNKTMVSTRENMARITILPREKTVNRIGKKG